MLHKHSLTRITILRLHKRVMVEPNNATATYGRRNVNVEVSSSDICEEDRGSTIMQDQSQSEDMTSLYWIGLFRGVKIIRLVSMYYVVV
jgi:hypothetical protein